MGNESFMKKFDRLIGIICVIKQNKKITAKELAEIFEVSERTVYRDIDVLCQLKVPIISHEGFKGGYEIDDKYFVPSIAMKENEILYLLICLKMGKIIEVPNMKEDYEGLRYKLLNVLSDRVKEEYKEILSRIHFKIDNIRVDDYEDNIMDTILNSLKENKKLKVQYYSPRENEVFNTDFAISSLLFSNGGWYIKGYSYFKDENRLFRIDRIRDLELLEETYEREVIDKKIKDEKYIKVILDMKNNLYDTLKRDKLFRRAPKKYFDEVVRVNLEVPESELHIVKTIITRNYENLTVIEPKFIVEDLKRMSEFILKKYE